MYSNVLRFFAIQRYTSKIEIIWLIKKFFPARISYLGFKSPVHANKKYTIDFSSLESATVSWYCSTNGSPPEMSMLHSAVVNNLLRNTYIYWEFFLLTFLVCLQWLSYSMQMYADCCCYKNQLWYHIVAVSILKLYPDCLRLPRVSETEFTSVY